MVDRVRTLMVVHAHPDDEALFTGGILAHYAAEGVRTVVVTCTNGELGYGPDGTGPDVPQHDERAVVALRMANLEESCNVLGVQHLELLGYHDSGMMGWAQNARPDAFWNVPVDAAADRLAESMDRYRPQVVVTYDSDGFYGHPDHIQTHRVTIEATARSGVAEKEYFIGIPKTTLAAFVELARQAGMELPDWVEGEPAFGTDDERIVATVDCTAVVDQKYRALAAHASQADNAFFLEMGRDLFGTVFGHEMFARAMDTTGSPLPETDLFTGTD